MAKKSLVIKNNKRKKVVEQFSDKRYELKELIRKPSTPGETRLEAIEKLQKLPRNASPIRVRNRCALTGRPRGVYSKFGLGRSKLRDKALSGELPGVMKASW